MRGLLQRINARCSSKVQTVVSSVFGRQFSNMAARLGSFIRFLISEMAASIAGETNFLSEGGGLAPRDERTKKRRIIT